MSEQVRADTSPIGSIVRAGIVEQAARTAMTTMELAERKRAERAIWARGDYHAIARAMF